MSGQPSINRRHLFGYASAAGIGTAAGVVGGRVSAGETAASSNEQVTRQRYSPFGDHQSGILTPTPASNRLVAFTLLPETDAAALGRLMRVWSGSIDALMSGRAVAGDTARDMAQEAVSLSVLVGFGPAVFELDGLNDKKPTGFQEIPAMDHDKLDPQWSGGDLLLMISADDETSVSYTERQLVRDAKPFATPRWVQDGSWRGVDAAGNPITGRNLFAQVDGTGNPKDDSLSSAVWSSEGWLAGGTQMVVRRIEMNLDTWDEVTRNDQERAIGRNLSNGAPLTGTEETDEMDLAATADGGLVIPAEAHARLSHPSQNNGRTMLRRGINYTHSQEGNTTSGLVFISFQANIAEQFVPVQQKLDAQDALNEWTTAIGSAVFVIPPGFSADSYVGAGLVS